MKRFLPFIIIVAVALLTVGIATTLYRSKVQPSPATPAVAATGTPTPTEEKEDKSLHVRGPRTAPVTMEIYGDFQCPPCAIASAIIDDLEKQYGQQMRVIFYEFPLAMHEHAMEAAMAAEAAGLQGRFWEMHDMLYKYQSVWSKASDVSTFFASYAESLGLDAGQFAIDAKSPQVQARIMSQGESGTARGVKKYSHDFCQRARGVGWLQAGKLADCDRRRAGGKEEILMAKMNENSPDKWSTAGRPRSSLILNWALAVIALLGLADATFLTVAHLTGDDAVCGSALGCYDRPRQRLRHDPRYSNCRVRCGGLLHRVQPRDSRRIWLHADERPAHGGGRADVRCLALFSLFAGFRLARLLSVLPFFGRADLLAGGIAPGVSRRSLKTFKATLSGERARNARFRRDRSFGRQILSNHRAAHRSFPWRIGRAAAPEIYDEIVRINRMTACLLF